MLENAEIDESGFETHGYWKLFTHTGLSVDWIVRDKKVKNGKK